MWKFDSRYILNRGVFPMSIVDPDAQTIYNRIIADGGVSNLSRLNFFVKGLKAIYGDLANVPVCYDAHWIGYKLGSGTGATAGQAAAKLYSLTVAGDAVQSTAASQPLLLAHNGASSDNYWWGSGVSGNYVSTPDASVNRIIGDIQIDFDKCNYIDLTNTGYIANKSNGASDASYGVALLGGTTGKFRFRFSSDGTNIQTFSSTLGLQDVGINANTTFYGRVTRSSSNGDIKFYYSLDGSTYTQLGTTVTSTPSGLWNSSNILTIGTSSGATNNYLGKISRVKISNSIGGAPVVDFNPATYNASTSQTAWTSATGEVWTINTGTATTGYKGCLVSRTLVQSDGVDDLLLTGNVDFSTTDKVTMYSAVKKLSTTFGLITTIGSNTNRISAFIDGITYRGFNTNGGLTNDYNTTTNSTALVLFTNTLDRSLTAINEQNFYYNNSLLGKVAIVSNDTTGNLGNNPIALFARLDSAAPSNNILNTFIATKVVDSSTIQTAVYNLIRSLNNNAF